MRLCSDNFTVQTHIQRPNTRRLHTSSLLASNSLGSQALGLRTGPHPQWPWRTQPVLWFVYPHFPKRPRITCSGTRGIYVPTFALFLSHSFPGLSILHTVLPIMYQTGHIYLITAIAVIGGGLFGFDISSMSAIISTQPYLCYFNQGPDGPGFNDVTTCSGPRASVQGGITASMAGGSWLGAIISGFLSDRLCRKGAIQIGSVIW